MAPRGPNFKKGRFSAVFCDGLGPRWGHVMALTQARSGPEGDFGPREGHETLADNGSCRVLRAKLIGKLFDSKGKSGHPQRG